MGKIKILVISDTAWSKNNSFGLTYSSIFEGMENVDIANIYCNYGCPDNTCVSKYFQITEKSLLSNFMDRNVSSGRAFLNIDLNDKCIDLDKTARSVYNKIKRRRWQLILWVRDFIWIAGRWKSPELRRFIEEYSPDLIFTPVYYLFHTNRILRYAAKLTKAPMVCYISDDIYTMKQYSMSPLYWIDRILKRKSIKKTIAGCRCIYTVCEAQSEEYSKIFKVPCKILLRPSDSEIYNYKNYEQTERKNNKKVFIYAGNLGGERTETIIRIGKEISARNGIFKVYSATAADDKTKKCFEKSGILFGGNISHDDVIKEFNNSDILVFSEGFSKKAFGFTRFSMSTKIPEYLTAGKTILAVGSKGIASIEYFRNNNVAVIADSKDKIGEAVEICIKHHPDYTENAKKCIKSDFDKSKIQYNIRKDICDIISGEGVEI